IHRQSAHRHTARERAAFRYRQAVVRELRVHGGQAGDIVDEWREDAADMADLAGRHTRSRCDIDQRFLAIAPGRYLIRIAARHRHIPRQNRANADDHRTFVTILAVFAQVDRQTHGVMHAIGRDVVEIVDAYIGGAEKGFETAVAVDIRPPADKFTTAQ